MIRAELRPCFGRTLVSLEIAELGRERPWRYLSLTPAEARELGAVLTRAADIALYER